MIKKLGTGKVTGQIGTEKWAEGVKSQISDATEQRGLNVRYLPLSQITLDPENPRSLAVDIQMVESMRELHPLREEWLSNASTVDWWDGYIKDVSQSLQAKALDDFTSIALLALSIKTPDRLINPVTVYSSDSGTLLRLVAGERRYLSHVLLGEALIASRILPEPPGELEKARLQWEENNLRVGLSFSEKYNNLCTLVASWEADQNKRMSVSQLVSLAGIPRVVSHRYLQVIRHPAPLMKQAIMSGQITSLRQAADLAAVNDLESALAPKKPLNKGPSCFSIKRQTSYEPVKKVLLAAASSLGGADYQRMLEEKQLDTPEALADAFNQLVLHVSKGMTSDA